MKKSFGIAIAGFLFVYSVASMFGEPDWYLTPTPRMVVRILWAGGLALLATGVIFWDIAHAMVDPAEAPHPSSSGQREQETSKQWAVVLMTVGWVMLLWLLLRMYDLW